MVVNMVVKPFVDVVYLAFNTQENLLVLCVLLCVPFIKPGQTPHQWSTNYSDKNRNPPIHDLHPALPDTLGLNAGVSGLLLLLALALRNGRAMKLLFALGETQTHRTYMAFKTNSPTTWKNVEGEQFAAFIAINRTHHY
jgi:hypothetical protein